MFCDKPIGIFDSGIGGLSVLKEMQKLMPNENYIYLADTENAPYGEKSSEDILRYSIHNTKKLVYLGCKAIVIACNTATAVAVDVLRKEFSIPIFGIEPAIKPAVENGGNVLILTTERTASEARFKQLVSRYQSSSNAKLFTLPVQKLVALVENGKAEMEETVDYLKSEFARFKNVKFKSCVLGCTHFPIAKKSIEKALEYRVEFFDGSSGTAGHVKSVLGKRELLNGSDLNGNVVFLKTRSNITK